MQHLCKSECALSCSLVLSLFHSFTLFLSLSVSLSVPCVCVQMAASLTFNWFLHCYGPLSLLIHVQVGRRHPPPFPLPFWATQPASCLLFVTLSLSGLRQQRLAQSPAKLKRVLSVGQVKLCCRYTQIYTSIFVCVYMCINMAYRYLQTTNYVYIYYHIRVLSCRSKDYERKTNKQKERQNSLLGACRNNGA